MCRFGLLACCACRALAEAGAKGLPCAAAQHCCRRYCLPLPVARRGVAAGAATCHTTAVKAKRALCLPSLLPLAPKHQRQNTEPALHSNATQGNQNPAAKQD